MIRAQHRVLMICTGNICRSPLAECVLRHKAIARGVKESLHVDSAGIDDWHAGESPDHRVLQVASLNNVIMSGTARVITHGDFDHFDTLICMDRSHRSHVLRMGAPKDKTHLLLEFDPDTSKRDVPDPYYGGIEGFHAVYHMIDRACEHLLDRLLQEKVQQR